MPKLSQSWRIAYVILILSGSAAHAEEEAQPTVVALPSPTPSISPDTVSSDAVTADWITIARDPAQPSEGTGIEDLVLVADAQTLEFWPPQNPEHASIELSGTYLRKTWSLLDEKNTPLLNGDIERVVDHFRMRITFDARREWPVLLQAIGPKGEVQKETVRLRTDIAAFLASQRVRTGWTPQVGFTYLNHDETGMASPYSQVGINVGVQYTKTWTDSPWTLGGTFSLTAFPILNSLPGVSAREINLSLNGGYVFSFLPSPWQLSLSLGFRYSSWWVTQAAFGYRNLFFPQIYPTLRRPITTAWTGLLYVRYSPLSQGFGLSLSERELAFGLGVEWAKIPLRLTVDYSSLAFEINPGHWIDSHGLTLSAGIPF